MEANLLNTGEKGMHVAATREGEEGIIYGCRPGYKSSRSNSHIQSSKSLWTQKIWVLVSGLAYSNYVTFGSYAPSSWMWSFNCTKAYPSQLLHLWFSMRMKWNAMRVWFVSVLRIQVESMSLQACWYSLGCNNIFMMKSYTNIITVLFLNV